MASSSKILALFSKEQLEEEFSDLVEFLEGVDLDNLSEEFAELLTEDVNQYRSKVNEIQSKFQVNFTEKGHRTYKALVAQR